MLFSHPEIAARMTQGFECAWESVRPAPRATIDFGDGRVLERTLHGNVATYFCTSRGEVYDLLPGLAEPREFARRLDQAVRLARGLSQEAGRVVEPGRARPAFPGSAIDPGDPRARRSSLVSAWHRSLAATRGAPEPLERDPVNIPDYSKMRVERRIDLSLAPPLAAHDAETLRLDSLHNRRERYPLASELWLAHPFARPADITRAVYRTLLGVDLDDPFLGLAPDVLGGEVGRHGALAPASAQ
ncbi:MAG TPA: hypothetical protein VF530_07515 [Planctomycetota bacterium]